MRILESYKSFNYNVGDLVYVEYWYDDHLTVCEILEKENRKYLISHDVSKSEIRNAPNEWIKIDSIVDKYRK
jgi:hypothetical protein